MIINFDELPEQVLENFKGGEKEARLTMFDDPLNRILLGRLAPGASIGLHLHGDNSEIMYFIAGQGQVLYDGGYEAVAAGQCHYCPKGHGHSLINNSDAELVFFAVVPRQ